MYIAYRVFCYVLVCVAYREEINPLFDEYLSVLDPWYKIDSRSFYSVYSGHGVADLEFLLKKLYKYNTKIFLVGDSTFDNKFWINGICDGQNGY